MTPQPALLRHAEALLTDLLGFARAADQAVSQYFRAHRQLGQNDRAWVAETVYAVLRRLRSLEAAAAGSRAPRDLLVAALVRVHGLSARALESVLPPADRALAARARALRQEGLPPAVRADLPDWLWARLVEEQGEAEAAEVAQGLLAAAPLDLRVNLARIDRDSARARLDAAGIESTPTPYSPAGLRLRGKPPINRDALFLDGLVEVQDEGSQLLAYLVAPRRGEKVVDYCAGAGGKTLAIAMLMRGMGRVYAMDVSAKRLAALAPRAARAGISSIHPITLSGANDVRAKRLGGKIDRVLVDAPCTGFGTLRRNPDLKWRHQAAAVDELALKQAGILHTAARLVKPGGRLVYATCSILQAENEAIAQGFVAAHPEFGVRSCHALLAAQRIDLTCGEHLRLKPQVHGTDGFFAAVFERG